MKNVFLLILSTLIIFAQFMSYRQGQDLAGRNGAAPVLYWATDPNPFRQLQIAGFREWLKTKGYPDIDLRIDPVNASLQKFIVQGTTGVADDLMDAYNQDLRFLNQMGLVADLTPYRSRIAPTFEGLSNLIHMDGQLIGYPRNVNLEGVFMVNRGAFSKAGVAEPPERWTLDEFERIGIEYTRAANKGLPRLENFFCDWIPIEVIRRSRGISQFNETLTATRVDTPEWIEMQKRLAKWRFVDHLMPLPADHAAFVVEAGFGGASIQVFRRGQIALLGAGRWTLIQLRRMGAPMELGACEFPHGGFPNALMGMSGVCVYRGSRNIPAASRFIEFLSSREHGNLVSEYADSNPATPAVLEEPAMLFPAKYTNEWAYHRLASKTQSRIAIGLEFSPYLEWNDYQRRLRRLVQSFENGLLDAAGLSREITEMGKDQFARYLKRHVEAQGAYDRALADQKVIDEAKARGEKIPLRLVVNPFLKEYYRRTDRGI